MNSLCITIILVAYLVGSYFTMVILATDIHVPEQHSKLLQNITNRCGIELGAPSLEGMIYIYNFTDY